MLKLAGIDVHAQSVAGVATCIELPGFGICFDIGQCTQGALRCDHVLVTHAHVDHLSGLVSHCATRGLLGMKPPTYIVPRDNEADIHALLDTWRRLDRSDLACTVKAMGPGEELPLKRGLRVLAVRAMHRVPCQGYVLIETRRRLRPDLAGLPPDQIRDRRLAGEQVQEEHHAPLVAFTGDTRFEMIRRNPILGQAKLLVMEVTFLDERVGLDQAHKSGHIHLDEVVAEPERLPNEAILFTHLSARYACDEARAILGARLPAGLRERVTLLCPPSPKAG